MALSQPGRADALEVGTGIANEGRVSPSAKQMRISLPK